MYPMVVSNDNQEGIPELQKYDEPVMSELVISFWVQFVAAAHLFFLFFFWLLFFFFSHCDIGIYILSHLPQIL